MLSSVNAMDNKEQMPNDDLISVLYLFVEMVHGKLPWRTTRNLPVSLYLLRTTPIHLYVLEDQTAQTTIASRPTSGCRKYRRKEDYHRLELFAACFRSN
jgi:hypothetical protein